MLEKVVVMTTEYITDYIRIEITHKNPELWKGGFKKVENMYWLKSCGNFEE